MYLSSQALRILAPGGLTAAEQREADEQAGRIVAALSRPWLRLADRTRSLTTVWAQPRIDPQPFEK
jgi:hypothetical protein